MSKLEVDYVIVQYFLKGYTEQKIQTLFTFSHRQKFQPANVVVLLVAEALEDSVGTDWTKVPSFGNQ